MTTITTRAGKTSPLTIAEVDANFTNLNNGKIETSAKDASGGVAGLTGFKLNLKNAAGNVTNFLTNATTAARTWTFPDKDGTVALIGDVLPNVTNVFSDAAPNVTTNAAGIQAVAPTTNANLLLIPKGTGGLSRWLPTTFRPLGASAVNLGTIFAKASGSGAVAFNDGAATGQSAAAFGNGTASGFASFATGGVATQSYAVSLGNGLATGVSAVATARGKSLGFATFTSNQGNAQGYCSSAFGNSGYVATSINYTINKISTSAGDNTQLSALTPLQVTGDEYDSYKLTANGINDGFDENDAVCFAIRANSSAAFELLIIARSSDGNTASWKAYGQLAVDSTGTATLLGLTLITISNVPVWGFTTANITARSNVPSVDGLTTTSGCIDITTALADAGTTISWGATITSCEVTL